MRVTGFQLIDKQLPRAPRGASLDVAVLNVWADLGGSPDLSGWVLARSERPSLQCHLRRDSGTLRKAATCH